MLPPPMVNGLVMKVTAAATGMLARHQTQCAAANSTSPAANATRSSPRDPTPVAAENLKEVGIAVTVKPVEFPEWQQLQQTGTYDMMFNIIDGNATPYYDQQTAGALANEGMEIAALTPGYDVELRPAAAPSDVCDLGYAGHERLRAARAEGLAGAREILGLSSHSASTIAEDFPHLSDRTRSLPGGVDTDLFRPDALDPNVLEELVGGPGRGPEQTADLIAVLDRAENAAVLVQDLRCIASSYDARAFDADAGERLAAFLDGSPLIVYLGKLIHSKGVHSLLSAFARVREPTGARLLVIGFGTFREGLEALAYSLGAGDEDILEQITESGKLLEGGPVSPLEHFGLTEDLVRVAANMDDDVAFIGPLEHRELSRILPAADVAVVPSIFPETFGPFLLGNPAVREVFMKHHADLLDVAFWQGHKERILAGHVHDVFPYEQDKRFRAQRSAHEAGI